jgi:hypothetical protein
MAHGIMEYDWMLSVKQKPWHGIGTIVEDAPTSDEAIKIAKLDWTIQQIPVMANGKEIPNYFANVRSDTNEALGVVRGRYKVVQNTEAFDFVDGIIGNKDVECRYETAGSLFNGRKIFFGSCSKWLSRRILSAGINAKRPYKEDCISYKGS